MKHCPAFPDMCSTEQKGSRRCEVSVMQKKKKKKKERKKRKGERERKKSILRSNIFGKQS